jgi:hypothetical protein
MIISTVCAALTLAPALNRSVTLQGASKPIKQVAILPWHFEDGTETAVKTAQDTVKTLFEKVNYEVVPEVRAKTVWEETLKKRLGSDIPDAKDLLELGKEMKVDLVCAGKAKWRTRSVWVALGPKTKADCTVSMVLIDVKKGEVVLDAKDVNADSTKVEKGWETAASLLVSAGFTVLSGGPKTPHQQRSAQMAIGKAMEPWLKLQAATPKKIGGV